jgi:outer membrane protein TolC
MLEVISLYVDLAAEQRHLPLLQRAIELEKQKVRIFEARREKGEILRLELLQATAALAAREAELAAAAHRQAEIYAELAEWVEGEPPGEFLAADLDWARMIQAPAGPGDPEASTALAESGGDVSSPGIWYNIAEIDLTFFYNIGSRDRSFADEQDRERGHTPGVELTLEFPLDLWRSGKSLTRQVEARTERKRLALLALNRKTAGRAREAALAHREAAAQVAAAEADLALREEELRVTQLRATDMIDSTTTTTNKGELEAIQAELELIKTKMALAQTRGDLARRYFERAMIHGADPKELAFAVSPGTSVAGTRQSAPGGAAGGGL